MDSLSDTQRKSFAVALLNRVLTALIFSVCFFPASSFTIVKVALLALLIVCFLLVIVIRGGITLHSGALIVILAIFCILGLFHLYYSIGFTKLGYMFSLRAYFGYVSMFTLVSVVCISIKEDLFFESTFSTSVFYGIFAYSLMKLILIALPLFGFLSVREVMELIQVYVGSVTYEFWSESSRLARISFGNDVLAPFFISYLLITGGSTVRASVGLKKAFYFLVVLLGVFSFTRYIWLLYAYIFCSYWFLVKGNFRRGVVTIVLLSLSIVGFAQFSWFFDILSTRGGDVTSLEVKGGQAKLLMEYWQEGWSTIFFGNGIGSYVPDLIRSDHQPYMYEVQWLAILMQLGVLGLVILLFYILMIVFGSGTTKMFLSKKGLFICGLFTLWLLSAFTNPYLFVFGSSLIYVLLFLLVESVSKVKVE